MNDVQKHDRDLLAKHYVWMFGTIFDVKVAEQKAILAGQRRTCPMFDRQ